MPTAPQVVEVAVALPVDKNFHYSVPKPLTIPLKIGHRLLVPFGRRTITGYVVGPGPQRVTGRLKDISDLPDPEPLFGKKQLAFFQQVARLTLSPLGEVIKTALPGGLAPGSRPHLELTDKGADALLVMFSDPKEKLVLETVRELKKVTVTTLLGRLNHQVDNKTVDSMIRRGLLVRRHALKNTGTPKRLERWVMRSVIGADADPETFRARAPMQAVLLELLTEERSWVELKRNGATDSALKGLVRRGLVEICQKECQRLPENCLSFAQQRPDRLTKEQQAAAAALIEAIKKNESRSFLLHGVTGSGKTEVYFRAIEAVLEMGKEAIVLVPEISLTPQLLGRLNGRFPNKVAVLHSRLSAGERFDQWRKIYRGEAPVVVGARSAIFAPLNFLGLIVIDEEHDDAFKQEDGVLYDARLIAELLGELHSGPVVSGSATPSLDIFHRSVVGRVTRLELSHRIERVPLPRFEVIDLRQEQQKPTGIARLLSLSLIQGIERTLAEKSQVILFLNRRGFSSFAQCKRCGKVIMCPSCEVSLTYHREARSLRCHYCGHNRAVPDSCPTCQGNLIMKGYGTQRIETEIDHFFPQAKTMRMDRDTTRGKNTLSRMLSSFSAGEADILVGTQMVAMGHDFPGVRFIGIIDADVALHFPDFRASEWTFQLLTQVAGRAGRRAEQGTVVIQTRDPGHYAIAAAVNHDYRAFYRQEIYYRKTLRYPPTTQMALVRFRTKDQKAANKVGDEIADYLKRMRKNDQSSDWDWIGPAPAPLSKIGDYYRTLLQLRSGDAQELLAAIDRFSAEIKKICLAHKVNYSIDLSPRNIL